MVSCGASLFRLHSQSTALYHVVLNCSDCIHRVLQCIMRYLTVHIAFTIQSTAVYHVHGSDCIHNIEYCIVSSGASFFKLRSQSIIMYKVLQSIV